MHRVGVIVVAAACVFSVAGCGTAGQRSAQVVAFDAHRKLSESSTRALDAVSGVTSVVPPNLTAADLMSAVTTPWKGFANAAVARVFNEQLVAARRAATAYASARTAAADGYVLTSYFIPNFGTHWINWAQVVAPFDPAKPAMLLYDGEGTDAHLVGLSYYQLSPNGPPAGFAGDNDRWHRHFGTCYVGGFLVGEDLPNQDLCRKICEARATNAIHAPVGTQAEGPEIQRYFAAHLAPAPALSYCNFVPGADLWMLHLWIVPGHPNPVGLFSTLNPKVAACVGLCRKT